MICAVNKTILLNTELTLPADGWNVKNAFFINKLLKVIQDLRVKYSPEFIFIFDISENSYSRTLAASWLQDPG